MADREGTMRVNGEARITAPLDQVWWALNDPAVLVRTVPGCERLEETGPDAYRMTVNAGMAAIKAAYSLDVLITDQVEPTSFAMRISGAGAPGTIRMDTRVRLTERGAGVTEVAYELDVLAAGVLGGVGQRVLSGIARKTADQFFRSVEDVLMGRAVPSSAVAGDVGLLAVARSRVLSTPRSLAAATELPAGFSSGAAVGAAGTLAGVLLGWMIGRRRR